MRAEGPVLDRCHGEPVGRGKMEALYLLCLVQRYLGFCVCVYACAHACVHVHMQRSEDSFQESGLSFCSVGPRN